MLRLWVGGYSRRHENGVVVRFYGYQRLPLLRRQSNMVKALLLCRIRGGKGECWASVPPLTSSLGHEGLPYSHGVNLVLVRAAGARLGGRDPDVNSVDAAETGQLPAGLSLADYLRIARAYWKGILAFTLVLTLGAFAWATYQPKIYAASSGAVVVAGGSGNLSTSMMSENLAKAKAGSYQSVAMSKLVAERVVEDLNLDISPASIQGAVKTALTPGTAEIVVTASSEDPAMAQRLADGWMNALVEQAEEMEKILSSEVPAPESTLGAGESVPGASGGAALEATPVARVVPLYKASLPTSPVSPDTKKILGIGGLAGLVLGLVYAFLRNHLDRRLRDASGVERKFAVSVIGTLPLDQRLEGKSGVLDEIHAGRGKNNGSHAMSEALRELRTNLQFIDVDNPPRIIVVTSSVPSEGKSTVTANLAVAMAAAGENVVVVDGDLRRPTLVDIFDLIPGVGVTDVLSGRAELADVLQQWSSLPNLHVLGSGRIPPNPSELLGSIAMRSLLDTLAKDAVVLIDAPPLLPVTDAAVLAQAADGAIVVVRAGKTREDELQRSLSNLERVKGKVLGTILNRVPTTGVGAYSYYSSYSSSPSEEAPGETTDLSGREDFYTSDPAVDTTIEDNLAGGNRMRSRRSSK